jgi:hypothetical protein
MIISPQIFKSLMLAVAMHGVFYGGGNECLNVVYIILSLQKISTCNIETGVRTMFEYRTVNKYFLVFFMANTRL